MWPADANGNIRTVTEGGSTTTYTYDSQNQLIREDNQAAGKSWTWSYDDAGNILSKKEYAYTTGTLGNAVSTKTYTYGNSNWGDLLTAYNGTDVTYDQIGNPESLNGRSYVWEHGRELRQVSYNGTTWTNTYDVNGLRAKREGGGKTYGYIYNGSQLSRMTVGSDTLTFFYDAAVNPLSLIHNGTTYYYATNLQGDVVALLNTSGTAVVTYTYDAWGKLLSTDGSMASTLGVLNPLRYRGSVYDTETGLYYLQSRYYDPEVGRFINGDACTTTGIGLLGNNMFAYCNNNPANLEDSTGSVPIPSGQSDPESMLHGGNNSNRIIVHFPRPNIIVEELPDYLNKDPQVVLESEGLSFYNGVPVLKVNLGNGGGFSCGVIILDDSYVANDIGIDVLNHEYGHCLQMKEIGAWSYYDMVVKPSLAGAFLTKVGIIPYEYYHSLPWEYVADVYGGVQEDWYAPMTQKFATVYWEFATGRSFWRR